MGNLHYQLSADNKIITDKQKGWYEAKYCSCHWHNERSIYTLGDTVGDTVSEEDDTDCNLQ